MADIAVHNSSGNVFVDIGFTPAEAQELMAKSALVLAIDEACTNVIRHAYHNQHDRPVELRLSERDEGMEVVMVDHGTGVKQEEMCGRALDDVRPGGLGLHMIREIMNETQYLPLEGRNELRLFKKKGSKTSVGE